MSTSAAISPILSMAPSTRGTPQFPPASSSHTNISSPSPNLSKRRRSPALSSSRPASRASSVRGTISATSTPTQYPQHPQQTPPSYATLSPNASLHPPSGSGVRTPVQQPDPLPPQSIASPKRQKPSTPEPKPLPRLYQNAEPKDLVLLISDMLQELVQLNDKIPLSGAQLTRFHSRAPPTISISDYLSRLTQHASLQPSILLSMVYYIDILSTHYPPFIVSSLTVHRFLITAATVASKGLCDAFLTNTIYARVGGVSLLELNMLELEFLVRVGWRIVPKPETLEDYYNSLVERLGMRFRIDTEEESLVREKKIKEEKERRELERREREKVKAARVAAAAAATSQQNGEGLTKGS